MKQTLAETSKKSFPYVQIDSKEDGKYSFVEVTLFLLSLVLPKEMKLKNGNKETLSLSISQF